MRIKINCTKEHLKKSMYCGARESKEPITENCWVALACNDIFPGCEVWQKGIEIQSRLGRIMIRIEDQVVSDMICTFDRLKENLKERLKLEPFSFEVDIDDKTLDKINNHYGYSLDSIHNIIEETNHLELV